MSSTQVEDVDDVLRFVRDCNDSFWSPECEVRVSSSGGVGVFAKQDLEAGTVLLRLPKTCVYSASNSSIANLLVDEEIDGVLALNIAFIYETTVFRQKSHWISYLKSIRIYNEEQRLELPPSHWAEGEKKWLRGSALDTLHGGLATDADVQEGFEMAIDLASKWNREFGLPVPEGYFDVDVSDRPDVLQKYQRFVATAYALSSRIFEIDAFHESGLVPIADLFNHHVSTPDVHFSSLYDVCQLCGEPGMCKHLVAEAALEAAEQGLSEQDDGTSSEEDEDNAEQDGESEDDERVDMALVRPVKAGHEIFNSYGDLSNSLLLARYGFTVAHNPHDVLHLGKEIRQLVRHNRRYAQRVAWWRQAGWKLYSRWYDSMQDPEGAPDDDDELPVKPWLSEMCIDSQGHPTGALTAFLNLLSLSESKWTKLRENVNSSPSDIQLLHKMGQAGSKGYLPRLIAYKQLSLQRPQTDAPDTVRTLLDSEYRIFERAKALHAPSRNKTHKEGL